MYVSISLRCQTPKHINNILRVSTRKQPFHQSWLVSNKIKIIMVRKVQYYSCFIVPFKCMSLKELLL